MKYENKLVEYLSKFGDEIKTKGKLIYPENQYYELVDEKYEYSYSVQNVNGENFYTIQIALPVKKHPEMHCPLLQIYFKEDGEIRVVDRETIEEALLVNNMNIDAETIITPNGTIIAELNTSNDQ